MEEKTEGLVVWYWDSNKLEQQWAQETGGVVIGYSGYLTRGWTGFAVTFVNIRVPLGPLSTRGRLELGAESLVLYCLRSIDITVQYPLDSATNSDRMNSLVDDSFLPWQTTAFGESLTNLDLLSRFDF
ncbi:hypothetical protein Tco_0212777 [Tanacetum coccineum]